ncbi:hypothetical protein JST99_04340 [Candidatus Dependentiae bacterium]|nr:hypothetical protein [Candidatus Dependentiae bacterium]MCC7415413.1 hypothetical protein [Campylobacterota bacterium]
MKRLLFCLIVCCSSIQAMEKVRRTVQRIVINVTQSSPCSTAAAFKFDSEPGDEEILKQLRRIRLHKYEVANTRPKKVSQTAERP